MNFFISHSSKDIKYGEAVLQLLLDVGVLQHQIIFTSKAGYGIPKGKDIFAWLKSKINEKPFVIYLLSEEYYSSIACLNEMGAAWVIENEHIALFKPGFNPDNPKFWEGAIEPRELGVFIDDKDDIFEFVGLILNKQKDNAQPVIINQAISKFMESIEKINCSLDSNHVYEIENDGKQYKEKKTDNILSNVSMPQPELKKDGKVLYEKFTEDIKKGKLTDEETLLICYMIEMGNDTLGDRWKAEQEIFNIKQWEEINNLKNFLSKKYDIALNKFKIRKYLRVYDKTSYGNPKEYILIDDISSNLLELPEEIISILNKTLSRYIKSDDIDTLPF